MRTGHTIRTARGCLHRLVEPEWQFDFLARPSEKLRPHTTPQVLVLAPELQRQIAVFPAEHFFGFELWPLPCDAPGVCPRDSKHLDPRQHGRDDDGMRPVDCERIERL